MIARSKGFRSGFSHIDVEFAILLNTANPGRKSIGEVKKVLNSRVRRMLDVESRASGGAEKVAGFAISTSEPPVALGGSMSLALVADDCSLPYFFLRQSCVNVVGRNLRPVFVMEEAMPVGRDMQHLSK